MAKKKGEVRIVIHLACNTCQSRNYTTTKNKRNDPERLSLEKYCPRCQSHQTHREQKA